MARPWSARSGSQRARRSKLITPIAPGTEHEWWINLYAIRIPDGVGFLVIDGPTARWDRPDGATELIPRLMEFGSESR